MKILIVDDEPVARQVLRELLEDFPFVEVAGEAASGEQALEEVARVHPDLLLLDMAMPGLGGLSVARALAGPHSPAVIFVTAYEQHAVGAFEVGALDYLLKPVRRERLEAALVKARAKLAERPLPEPAPARKILGRLGTDLYMLDPSEVVAFQAEGEIVHILTASRRYLSEHSLKALETRVGPRFRRIHRRTIVNTDHIRRISPLSSKRWLLKMSNGLEAVVSKRMAGAIREQVKW